MTGRKRARETIRVFGPRLSETVVSVSRKLEVDGAKGRYLRRNFELKKRFICSYIDNLVAGCAGSFVRTRLRRSYSLFPGKEEGMSAKIGVFGDGRRENAAVQRVGGQIPYAQ